MDHQTSPTGISYNESLKLALSEAGRHLASAAEQHAIATRSLEAGELASAMLATDVGRSFADDAGAAFTTAGVALMGLQHSAYERAR